MKTTLIVPALNELEGLKKVMTRVPRVDQTVVLVGKPILDDTIAWTKAQGYDVFLGEENLWYGYRNLFLSGIIKGEVVITFSPDGNSIPETVLPLLEKIESGYDMVIASRYLNGAISEDDTKLTSFGNKVLTGIVNLRSGFRYTDALVMYRAYRIEIVNQLGLLEPLTLTQRVLARMTGLYSWEPSLSIRAGRVPLRVAEIPANEPIAFRKRRQNTFVHGLAIGTQIIQEEWFR